MIIKLKEYPELHTAIKKALPKYRKHSAIVNTYSTVTPNGSAWSGGSRSWYAECPVTGGNLVPLDYSTDPVEFGGSEPVPHKIREGFMVLSGGTFCGKPSTINVYLHPADYARIIGK